MSINSLFLIVEQQQAMIAMTLQAASTEHKETMMTTTTTGTASLIMRHPKKQQAFFFQKPTSKNTNTAAAPFPSGADEFYSAGTIPMSQQGKHEKNMSQLNHKDVKDQCIEWFKREEPTQRDQHLFKKHILEDAILPTVLGTAVVSVSLQTLRMFMDIWGFKYRKNTKGTYFEGHEIPDVVQYRQEWATRMMRRKQHLDDSEGEDMEIIIEPTLQHGDKKKWIMVTHEESTFYANDGNEKG
ncbi:hypothetical protein BDB00DRAFT_871853 [Zychaea mexicana]|uniref:uncharacterized protein n=1 Tax=Zychaea mexicana TaxID=64656 RepID=UPI0022FDC122|nr:uncharacterized protein BDB00DRAFT_871853 [Zychaea mexicana]KAI9494105.1 hypothetical protein BDB00DRAFT_871853 [Zychaea mexicana]